MNASINTPATYLDRTELGHISNMPNHHSLFVQEEAETYDDTEPKTEQEYEAAMAWNRVHFPHYFAAEIASEIKVSPKIQQEPQMQSLRDKPEKRGLTIIQLAENRFSITTPAAAGGETYEVWAVSGHWRCTCKRYIYGGGTCKHIPLIQAESSAQMKRIREQKLGACNEMQAASSGSTAEPGCSESAPF